jgi:serine/threonine-protein kinase
MIAAAPASPTRRWTSARPRKSQELLDDDVPSPRRRTTQREELESEPEPALQPTEAAAPAAHGPAKLRINSRPWSQIFVDGKPVGNTPQLALQVNAGHHTIRLVNPELDVSKTFELDAHAGETLSRVELLTD